MFEDLCEKPPRLEDDPLVYRAWLHEMDKLWHRTLKWFAAARTAAQLETGVLRRATVSTTTARDGY